MKHYVKTNAGIIKNQDGDIILFDSLDDARNWVINHLDLSEKGLSIENLEGKTTTRWVGHDELEKIFNPGEVKK
jgi:hypothetical protein